MLSEQNLKEKILDNAPPKSKTKESIVEVFSSEQISFVLEEAEATLESSNIAEAYDLLIALSTYPILKEGSELSVQHQLLMGRVLREQGQFDEAKRCFETAKQFAQEAQLKALEGDSFNQLASISFMLGNTSDALSNLENAEVIFNLLGLQQKRAVVLNNIGMLCRNLSEYQTALIKLKEAYGILKDIAPESRAAATNLLELGLSYVALNKYERAEVFYKDAHAIALKLEDKIIEVVSLINLAEVYLEIDDLSQAESEYEKARELSVKSQLKLYEINAIEGLGNVYHSKAFYARAKVSHEQAVQLAIKIGDKGNHLINLLRLAKDELAMHNIIESLQHAHEALLLAEETEQLRQLFECHELMGKAYKLSGEFEKAIFHLESYHRIERQIFNKEKNDKTSRLTVKFDVEKANHEAEMYRLKSQLEEEAHDAAKRLVRERTQELEEAQIEIVSRLAVAAEYRDDDTGEHTRRVGRTAALIAYILGWDMEMLQLLYTAARLHDVGKIGISDTILLKPGKFTDEEYELMKTHTSIGASILSNGHSSLLMLAEEIALFHHERWDGQGYPHKVKGEAIPLAARIVSVCDVLDALTHARPYKKAWTVAETLEEIRRNKGSQFDPQVVDACMILFDDKKGFFSPTDAVESWEKLLEEFERVKPIREERQKTKNYKL